MATTLTLDVAPVFAAGTTLGAYAFYSEFPNGTTPPVAATATAVVASDGTVSFTGLTAATHYWVGTGLTPWRYIGATTTPASTSGGSGTTVVDRGTWAATTAYAVGDRYTDPNGLRRDVTTAYTSGGTFGTTDTTKTAVAGSATVGTSNVFIQATQPAQGASAWVWYPTVNGTWNGQTQTYVPDVPAAPVFSVAPAVTGSTIIPGTLTCDGGTVTGSPTPTKTYQWKRDGAAISGATSAAYTTQAADAGHAVLCTVTATNSQGTASADSNSNTPAASFDPATVTGMQVWFKADAITGLSDGANISSWPDSSTNTRNLQQAITGHYPIYKAAVINGLPVARFDGVAQQMSTTGSFASAQYPHVFVVAKTSSVASGYRQIVNHPTNGASWGAPYARWALRTTGSAGKSWEAGVQDLTSNTNSALADSSVNPLTTFFRVLTLEWDGTFVNLRRDGVQIASTDAAASGALTQATTPLFVGANPAPGEFWNGDIAEIIVYDNQTLSTGNRNSIESYLGNKYGITIG